MFNDKLVIKASNSIKNNTLEYLCQHVSSQRITEIDMITWFQINIDLTSPIMFSNDEDDMDMMKKFSITDLDKYLDTEIEKDIKDGKYCYYSIVHVEYTEENTATIKCYGFANIRDLVEVNIGNEDGLISVDRLEIPKLKSYKSEIASKMENCETLISELQQQLKTQNDRFIDLQEQTDVNHYKIYGFEKQIPHVYKTYEEYKDRTDEPLEIKLKELNNDISKNMHVTRDAIKHTENIIKENEVRIFEYSKVLKHIQHEIDDIQLRRKSTHEYDEQIIEIIGFYDDAVWTTLPSSRYYNCYVKKHNGSEVIPRKLEFDAIRIYEKHSDKIKNVELLEKIRKNYIYEMKEMNCEPKL